MKITANKMDLVAGLNKLTKVIGAKNTVAILDYVKISALNNEVTLTGINNDLIGIVTLENTTIEENGEALIYFKNLLAFTKKTKSNDIVIENESNLIKVISNKVNYKVDSIDPDNFPQLPKLDYKEVTLNNEEFRKAIENTGYCISKSEIRPILNAINIKVNEYEMKFVSTDSHRLGQFKLNKDSNIDQMEINPLGEGLNLAYKLLDKKAKSNVTFKFDSRYTVLEFDNMQLFVRNVEGNYPETDRLIPNSFSTEMELKTSELLDLLPQLSVFSKDENNNVITLNFEYNKATLSSDSKEVGSISSNIEVNNNKGEDFKINFSSKFLLDVLKTVEGNKVKMSFMGGMRPFVIEGIGKGEKHLIMPVRTY